MITEKIICGLDVGSQSLKASLVKVKRSKKFELLGVCEIAVRGFKKSQVNDLGDLPRAFTMPCGMLRARAVSNSKKCSWVWAAI